MQITHRPLLTWLSWHHTLWFNLCKSRMWENKILSHLHITSHCLLQLVWLFITTSSRASHCSRPIQESDLYPVDCLGGRKWDVWSSSVVTCTLPHSHGQPLRAWQLSRAMQGLRSTAGAWVRSTHCAPRDPTSPGPKAQLSRTWRTGAENFQASHC